MTIRHVLDWYRTSAVAMVARGLLILGGFVFLLVVALNLSSETTRSDCWSNVLDRAVTHAPLRGAVKDSILAQAQHCARLPH